MADNAGLTNHAFGDEGINRHVIVWKKVGLVIGLPVAMCVCVSKKDER